MRDGQHGGKTARILVSAIFLLAALAGSGIPVMSWAQVSTSNPTSPHARAQSPDSIDLNTVGSDSRWKIVGRTVSAVDIKEKHAIRISEGAGMATIAESNSRQT